MSRRIDLGKDFKSFRDDPIHLTGFHPASIIQLYVYLKASQVKAAHRIRNLDAPFQKIPDLKRFTSKTMPERLALQKFHHDKWPAFVLANIVNCAVVLVGLIRQKLERDVAVKTGFFGSVDHAHAAGAQLFENSIVSGNAAGHALA